VNPARELTGVALDLDAAGGALTLDVTGGFAAELRLGVHLALTTLDNQADAAARLDFGSDCRGGGVASRLEVVVGDLVPAASAGAAGTVQVRSVLGAEIFGDRDAGHGQFRLHVGSDLDQSVDRPLHGFQLGAKLAFTAAGETSVFTTTTARQATGDQCG
jgi:hypothetical protein